MKRKVCKFVQVGWAVLLLGLQWHCGSKGVCGKDQDCQKNHVCQTSLCLKTCQADADCHADQRCTTVGVCHVRDEYETTKEAGSQEEPNPEPQVVEGSCFANQTRPCYGGHAGTQGKGVCRAGNHVCRDGRWSACEGEVRSTEELCDGLDNDCDGKNDEGCLSCTFKVIENMARGHRGIVYAMAYKPQGDLFASASKDLRVKLWESPHGRLVHDLKGHKRPVLMLAFHPEGHLLASASSEPSVMLWDVKSGQAHHTLETGQRTLVGLAFAPKGEWLLTADQRRILFWDLKTYKVMREIKVPERLYSFELSSSGNYMVGRVGSTEIRIWEVATAKVLKASQEIIHQANCMAISPDEKLLATCQNNRVYLWDLQTLKKRSESEWDKSDNFFKLVFSPDSRHILAFSYANRLALLNSETLKKEASLQFSVRVVGVAFSPDGKSVVAGLTNGDIEKWNLTEPKREFVIERSQFWRFPRVAFHPKGESFATISEESAVHVWERKTLKKMLLFRQEQAKVRLVRFSPDGKYLLVTIDDPKDSVFQLWALSSKTNVYTSRQEHGAIQDVVFHPDGSLLVSVSNQHTVDLWDTTTGKHLRSLRGHSGPIHSVSVAPSGKRIATGGWDNTIKIWDLQSGEATLTLVGHRGEVTAVAFGPEGKTLFSASIYGEIKRWDLEKKKESQQFIGHEHQVNSLVIHPNAKWLFSGSLDGTVRIWNLESAKALSTLKGDHSGVYDISISPDGKDLLSSAAEQILLWRCPLLGE